MISKEAFEAVVNRDIDGLLDDLWGDGIPDDIRFAPITEDDWKKRREMFGLDDD